jgi:hypothetical protein
MSSFVISIEKLPDAVMGNDPKFSRTAAMAQLVASEREDRETLLARVLENSAEPRRNRIAAAISLGRVATHSTQRILLRNLPKTADDSFPEVLCSLGRIGDREALDAIGALELPPQHPASRTAAYAAALIAYRLGLPGHELPFPSETDLLKPPTAQTRPIKLTPLGEATAREVLAAMKRHPYGISFDSGSLIRIQCAGEINVVCFNREFLGTAAARLRERKGIPAMCALQSPETADYSVSYVFLARPTSRTPDAIEIMVHRCSGTLALAGTGEIVGARVEFELRSVRRPGAWAISVKGGVEDGRIEIIEAASSTAREQPREPSRLVV